MAHIPRSFHTFDLKYYRKKSLTKTSGKNENTLNVLRIRLEKLSFIEVLSMDTPVRVRVKSCSKYMIDLNSA
jgi:hypothetical protein